MRHSVRESDIETVKKAITELLDGVRRNEPHTRYEVYKVRGTNSFIHFMCFPDEQAEQINKVASYTQHFIETVHPLCTDKPKFADLDKIEGMTGGEYE